MNRLIDAMSKFMEETIKEVEPSVKIEDLYPDNFSENSLFKIVEIMTFSSYDEIVGMLDHIEKNYWLETPVWLLNLAYRLACLLEPNNADIKRRAAASLLFFGPDWDEIVAKLDEEADEIEAAMGIKDSL